MVIRPSSCAYSALGFGSGAGCAAVVDRVFRLERGTPLAEAPNRKLLLGALHDRQGRVIDQALAVYCRAPHSYTGEDIVELSCHGGIFLLNKVLEFVIESGADRRRRASLQKEHFSTEKRI